MILRAIPRQQRFEVGEIGRRIAAGQHIEYRFERGALPTDEVITLDIRTNELLHQGIRRTHPFSRIRRGVGPPTTRYELAEGWEEALDGLDLGEGERLLIECLRAGGTSVKDLCAEVFLSNFEIYQTIWSFKVLGAIRATPETAAENTGPPPGSRRHAKS